MSNVRSLAQARVARSNQETPQYGGKGFALLHRKIMDLPFYRTDSEAVHLWVHLIMSANHAPAAVTTEFGEIIVRRGEFITGRNTLATETGVTGDRIKYLLNKFEKLGMISRISSTKFTRIFVTKYDEYQPNSVPAECQQNANLNPHTPTPSAEVVPAECQQSATNNELLTNNSISKDIECASSPESKAKKTPTLSCQDVVDAYHELLPNSPKVRALSDKRKNKIRTFWAKAGKITRQLDGKPFSMQAWREYLEYISTNCTWMICQRDNQRNGTTWHKKDIDFMLSDDVYLKVREGGHDDR